MDSKCLFVKLVAQFSNKILYGYNCNLEGLYADIREANRFYILEQNIESCKLHGDIIDELNKFKRKLNDTFTTYCRDCVEESILNCSDIVVTITNTYSSATTYFTFVATATNTTNPVTFNWSYDPTYWALISKNKNKLILQPIISSGIYVYTSIGLAVSDANSCLVSKSTMVNYHGGCIDSEAENYDPTAILSNGTCTYPDPPLT